MTENIQVGTRLLFENERIRVWDITLEPGQRLPPRSRERGRDDGSLYDGGAARLTAR